MSGTITINSTDLASAIKPQLLQMPEISQQSYNYVVWTDGTTIYAKDGQTGRIVTSNTDLGKVLQTIVDTIPDNGAGVIYIKPSRYLMNSSVRIARKGIALIGGFVWDATSSGYKTTNIFLTQDNISYFIIGDDTSSAPTLFFMMGFGVDGADVNGNPINHTGSILVEMHNWIRHSMFRQMFINGVGTAFMHKQTYAPSRGLEDVYFEHIAVERVKTRALNLAFTGYNIRLTDVYVGENYTDDWIIGITNGYDVFISRLWFWTDNTYRGVILSGGNRIIVRDTIIKGTRNETFRIQNASNVLVDNVIVDAGTYKTAKVFHLSNNVNLEIRNVYAKYTTTPVYVEAGSPPRLANCRFLNVNTNIEYRSENRGVATITAGTTRTTVTHNLIFTPSRVFITPIAQPPGKVWVENITSTSFDIVTDTAPTANLNVAWYAEI